MRKILYPLVLIIGIAFVHITSRTASSIKFYKGKTLRLIVFGSPGEETTSGAESWPVTCQTTSPVSLNSLSRTCLEQPA